MHSSSIWNSSTLEQQLALDGAEHMVVAQKCGVVGDWYRNMLFQILFEGVIFFHVIISETYLMVPHNYY